MTPPGITKSSGITKRRRGRPKVSPKWNRAKMEEIVLFLKTHTRKEATAKFGLNAADLSRKIYKFNIGELT